VPQPNSYHHGDLRAALLDAVGDIVREKGPAGVSLREAARRARVSHSAPAHHFGNKAGLLTAFATQGYQRLAEFVVGSITELAPDDGPATLAAVGRGYVRFAIANPDQFGVMFRPELLDADDAEFVAASDAAYTLLVATIAQCAAEGRLDADPEATAVAAWSLVHGLATLWISGRLTGRIAEPDPNRLAEAVTTLFVERIMP